MKAMNIGKQAREGPNVIDVCLFDVMIVGFVRGNRLQKKVKSLKDIISNLGDKNMIFENLREQLDDKFSAVPLEIFKKMTKLKKS